MRSPDFNVEIECDLDFEDERQHYKLTIEDIKEMQDEDDGQDEASPEAESSQTEAELSSQSPCFPVQGENNNNLFHFITRNKQLNIGKVVRQEISPSQMSNQNSGN